MILQVFVLFDVQTELENLKKQTKQIRKRSYRERRSRLDKFTYEILQLHKNGASGAEIQRFLCAKRIKVSHSTVQRWLAKYE